MARHLSVDDLLAYHKVGDLQLSPDGRTLLFVKEHVGDKIGITERNLWITDLATGVVKQFTALGDVAQLLTAVRTVSAVTANADIDIGNSIATRSTVTTLQTGTGNITLPFHFPDDQRLPK